MITIPKLADLFTQIKADLESELSLSIPVFGKVFLNAIAAVQAAKLKIFYLALAGVQKNIWPDTADQENLGGTLERFGRVKLGRNPNQATQGTYSCVVTGDDGSIIPAGTTFKSDDDSRNPGFLFILDNAYTLVSGTDTITLRALDAGTQSLLEVGDTLTATAPIAGVNATATVSTVTSSPINAESIEDYRLKILNAFKLEPQGGASTDYILWSQDAAGALRVYPFAKSGSTNELNLFVEASLADSTDGKGTPTNTILNNVQAVVEYNPDTTLPTLERGRKPLDVIVNYEPVTPLDVDITVSGFVGKTTEIETLLRNALKEMISNIRPFVAAAYPLEDKNDILNINMIIANILATRPGSVFGAVTMTVDGSSVTTFQFLDGDIPFPTITINA